MTSFVYNQFKSEVMKGTYNLDNGGDTLKCGLLDNTATPSESSTGWSGVSGDEVSGTGYTAGGETLSSQAITQDDTNNYGVFDAGDVSWTNASFTARYAVIYDDTPTTPADPLICLIDFGSDKTVTSGTFTITWDGDGIMRITD